MSKQQTEQKGTQQAQRFCAQCVTMFYNRAIRSSEYPSGTDQQTESKHLTQALNQAAEDNVHPGQPHPVLTTLAP